MGPAGSVWPCARQLASLILGRFLFLLCEKCLTCRVVSSLRLYCMASPGAGALGLFVRSSRGHWAPV